MAFAKLCPNCKQQSFSAGLDINWLCPHCGENLSNIPVMKNFDKFMNGEKNEDEVKSE
ncbi:MAG TPA: hypothetical protein PK728_08925 [Bacillota bacterium]|nr:hypothetical protein [Bacillota bacterium]